MLNVSKCSFSQWRKYQALLDVAEMQALYNYLFPIYFFNVSQLLPLEKLEVEEKEFFNQYSLYIEGLKNGEVVISKELLSAFSVEKGVFNPFFICDGKYKATPVVPVVQMQPYRFALSPEKGVLSMVMGQKNIEWGVQFSYPQVFHNGSGYIKGRDLESLPNSPMFKKLVQWLRSETVPMTFIFNKKKFPTSIRLGKGCFSWINTYLSRISQEISIFA